ncbi:hypothetical protein A5906_26220 [Bradyrhizobium sacchari]|nr:hypothetical protein A5906_26220 [Bradyrhizobium sacchari]
MQRHSGSKPVPAPAVQAPPAKFPPGDVLYGARAIALWLFPDEDPDQTRRRVYHLWAYYDQENEEKKDKKNATEPEASEDPAAAKRSEARKQEREFAGFFKLKGALCLSKSKWLAFHGLA